MTPTEHLAIKCEESEAVKTAANALRSAYENKSDIGSAKQDLKLALRATGTGFRVVDNMVRVAAMNLSREFPQDVAMPATVAGGDESGQRWGAGRIGSGGNEAGERWGGR